MSDTQEKDPQRAPGLRNNPWVRQQNVNIRWFLSLCVCACILLIVVRQMRWDVGLLPALLSVLPWAGVMCAGIALLAWRLRMSSVAVVALIVTLAVAYLWAPAFTVNEQAKPIAGAPTLRLMSFNCMGNPATSGALARAAQADSVDVLAVVEAVPFIHRDLANSALSTLFKYRYLTADNQVGIWSRRPLSDISSLPMGFGGKAARVRIGGSTLTLLAVHPRSPRYTQAAQWRHDQSQLMGIVREQPAGPLVVAGDFNMTRDNDAFRDSLNNGFVDAADINGKGWKGTWSYGPDNWALVAIDHFLGRGVHMSHFDTVVIDGSDHRAIVSDIQVGG